MGSVLTGNRVGVRVGAIVPFRFFFAFFAHGSLLF
jgi:hypothetical protein